MVSATHPPLQKSHSFERFVTDSPNRNANIKRIFGFAKISLFFYSKLVDDAGHTGILVQSPEDVADIHADALVVARRAVEVAGERFRKFDTCKSQNV